ncbi:MAG: hypothetical protein NUV69_03050 [Candidatus Curtissbacteria bacterium]|nr:hypothetical protein [Candidatus Curtissbacteria bacterium]
MNLRNFSIVISRIFDFWFWSPIVMFSVFTTGLTSQQITLLVPLLLTLNLIVPVGIFLYLLKSGRVTDIDMTKREERHIVWGVATLSFLLSTTLVYFLANYLFFVISFTVFIVTLTLFIITFKWKISVHVITNTTSVFVINYLFDWKLLWLFAVVPVVAFARFYLKKHTLSQILAGFAVGIIEPYIILEVFGLM